MRTPTTLLTLACTLAGTLVLGCGDDGPGDVDSGLTAEKKASDLTPSEQETLCRAKADNLAARVSATDAKRFGCIAASAVLGGDDPVAFCESFVPMCLDAPEQGEGGGTDTCMLDTSTCEASVSDLEACFTEQNEATAAAFQEASCADLGKQPGTAVVGPLCSKIKATCPLAG